MDMTMAGALGRLTMDLPVTITVGGDMATKWRRFAVVTIIQSMEVAVHLREFTNQRLLPTRCRLYRRGRVLVARDHVEVYLQKY
jgi:hypothetical protein